jgi:hypothetical protein
MLVINCKKRTGLVDKSAAGTKECNKETEEGLEHKHATLIFSKIGKIKHAYYLNNMLLLTS